MPLLPRTQCKQSAKAHYCHEGSTEGCDARSKTGAHNHTRHSNRRLDIHTLPYSSTYFQIHLRLASDNAAPLELISNLFHRLWHELLLLSFPKYCHPLFLLQQYLGLAHFLGLPCFICCLEGCAPTLALSTRLQLSLCYRLELFRAYLQERFRDASSTTVRPSSLGPSLCFLGRNQRHHLHRHQAFPPQYR